MPDPAAAPALAPDDAAVFRAIVEGTARETGQAFFESLVKNLASALGVAYAFVAEFAGSNTVVRTLALWAHDKCVPNIEFDISNTPCRDVLLGDLCHYPRELARFFPTNEAIRNLGIQSYLGVPLRDAQGNVMGHLAVEDTKPMPDEPRTLAVFHIFAARAGAELERLRMEQQLRESEERFRDLFEQAPMAYVYEGSDSRFVYANKTALSILGVQPEEIPATRGLDLVAPADRPRIAAAFKAVSEGKEQAWVEFELARKDNGQPIWIQWWSKPDPDGKHTRTMFIDITQRVLMEREKARLEQQNEYLQEEIKAVHNFEEIVGRAPGLVTVLEGVRRVARTTASVLVTGETGTGKELIARAIHSASDRHDRPLIKLNCAALPTGLVESELFGHEKGAFSGAIARRPGRFELAHTGTLFLDEVGEIPLDVQAKLLRVLQEKEFERVGGSQPIKVDVRIVAATNRDLLHSVRRGKFREDLYYRLNVFPLHLPPLRERREDIPLLVSFLLEKFRTRLGKEVRSVSRETMARLVDYPWPGNIRELENIIERAMILATGPVLTIPEDVLKPPAVAADSTPERPLPADLKSLEREHILKALQDARWIIDGPRGAARVLGLHPNTLRSRLQKLGIRRPDGTPS